MAKEKAMVLVALAIHRAGILRSSGVPSMFFVIAVLRAIQDVKREIRARLLLAIDHNSTAGCRSTCV
jgi:hypothetical protein